jgi:Family of unknown function (DUF6519)
MGDFSRNPKQRLVDSINKHYIGVRMQQGVPILDADWNEMEDLRRNEFETMGSWFIGSGVPSGSDGFRIFSVSDPNDFGIFNGLCFVQGKLVFNDSDITYTTQPHFGNPDLDLPIEPLEAPMSSKQYIVYLDTWEREVESTEDSEMMDVRIGMETTIRIKREWAVRVASVPEDLAALQSPPSGHIYYSLAQLNRESGNYIITRDMILDLRDTQVSVKRKIEVRNNDGFIVVDADRFKQMLESTRDNILAFIRYISTKFNTGSTVLMSAEIVGLQTAEHIARTAEVGIGMVNGENLANQGALNYLFQLYNAQNNFMSLWRDEVLPLGGVPAKYESYEMFIEQLDERLHLPDIGIMHGLLPSLESSDLEDAVDIQEEIARLIGASAEEIPRGSILVSLTKSPPGNLTLGQVVRFEFTITSFTTLADTYTVDLLPVSGWLRLLVDTNGVPIPGNRITVGANGTETILLVDVTVGAGSSDLQLRVTSDANPSEIDQLTGLFTLTEGQPAPVGEDDVQLHISQVSNATENPSTGVISIVKTVQGLIEIRVYNFIGEEKEFTLSLSNDEVIGDWVTEFSGANTLIVPDSESRPKVIKVTPGADAVTMQLTVTAETLVASDTVSGQLVIPISATSS